MPIVLASSYLGLGGACLHASKAPVNRLPVLNPSPNRPNPLIRIGLLVRRLANAIWPPSAARTVPGAGAAGVTGAGIPGGAQTGPGRSWPLVKDHDLAAGAGNHLVAPSA
jgi:hypothetical protein